MNILDHGIGNVVLKRFSQTRLLALANIELFIEDPDYNNGTSLLVKDILLGTIPEIDAHNNFLADGT